MKMKKNVFKLTMVAVVVLLAGYNVYESHVKIGLLSDIELANVEALAGDESWFEEWWDSKTYTCQSVQGWYYDCMPYKDVPKENGDWEVNIGNFQPDEIVCGYFKGWDTDCVSGNDVAHCWDCE